MIKLVVEVKDSGLRFMKHNLFGPHPSIIEDEKRAFAEDWMSIGKSANVDVSENGTREFNWRRRN